MRLLLTTIGTLFLSIISYSQTTTELVEKRTMYSKTFVQENGTKEQVLSMKPVHYLSENNWLPINNDLVVNGQNIENTTNVLTTSFPNQVNANSSATLEFNGNVISINSLKKLVTYSSLNGVYELNNVALSSNGTVDGNTINYANMYQGFSDKYTVLNGEIKNDFSIDSYPSFLNNSNDEFFGIKERIQLPDGWNIVTAFPSNQELVSSDLVITNELNEHILTIPAPIIYDANSSPSDGDEQLMGHFIVDKDANGWILTTLVPISYLKASTTAYPVVIDPSVILAGNTGGWQSQNNYVNNPGYVFIGVCCGNLEHRAWLKYDISSIPDNSCVTAVELEVYVNGVGASTPEVVHAYDMMATTSIGIFGPYGGIIPAVYNDMGTGYYTSFTLAGTGYYGYYDLGANAAADLQSMLSADWFQVALIFDNEPSTNWKRLTAGLCNLRIAYDAPPCTPLPVGLVDFEANCSDGRPLLTWSTVSESNSDFFTVWKSENGDNYTEIGKVTAQGNSSDIHDYRWLDNASNEIAYYKLSQTDQDGTEEYFDPVVYLGCDNNTPTLFTDASNSIHVRGNQITQVVVRDNMGQIIINESSIDGKNEFVLASHMLKNGTYSATIEYEYGKMKTVKFPFIKK